MLVFVCIYGTDCLYTIIKPQSSPLSEESPKWSRCKDTILHELPISASAAQWWCDDNVPFIEHLLHERYHANLFLYIISFNLYSSPMKRLLGLLALFYRLGNQCLDILSDLTLTWVYMDSKQQILDLKTCLPCRLPVPGCFSSFLASLEILGKRKIHSFVKNNWGFLAFTNRLFITMLP